MKKLTKAVHDISPENDILGKALLDYYSGNKNATLEVFSNISDADNIPVKHFFRTWDCMQQVEQKAMDFCRGKILDAGAAAGCHSIILQKRGFDVHAIDVSPGAAEVMEKQGLKNVSQHDYFNLEAQNFDTLLLLMNGIGICGKLESLDSFFVQARRLLNPGGQILLDSSDIIYMFEQEDGSYLIDLNSNYYGEVVYQFGYDGNKSTPFNWLFVDFDLLCEYAARHHFRCGMIAEGSNFDYLARLSMM